MQHFVNFGLLFCFVTLSVTGVLAYALPFSMETTRIHMVFGLATVVLVGLHLGSRLRYFRQQLKGQAVQGVSRAGLGWIVVIWLGLLAAAMWNWAPAAQLADQSYEARQRSAIVRTSPLAGFAETAPGVTLTARKRRSSDRVATSIQLTLRDPDAPAPAIAIWAETTTGSMIETLYLSGEVAYSDQPNWHGSVTPRKAILPVWRHRYTLVTGIDPDGQVDAVTGATASHKFSLDAYFDDRESDYLIFVEINAPGDPEGEWSDPQVGQPSVLYSVFVEHGAAARYYIADCIGHGGDAQDSGDIRYDLERIGSAKNLVDFILVRAESLEPEEAP